MPLVILSITLLTAFAIWRWVMLRANSCPTALATVAGPEKEHWLTGNLHRLFKDGLEYNLDLFRRYGGVTKVYGMLGAEQLLVYDPLALHHILFRCQDAFEETDMFIQTNKLLFGEGLISTLGEQHRKQRKLLNPVFSLANLRSILPKIQSISDELVELLQDALPTKDEVQEVNVLPWLGRGTVEYVGQGILGITFDSLEPTKIHPYTDAIRNVQQTAIKVLPLRPFVPWAVQNLSSYWRNKLVDWLPFPAVRELRDMARIMHRSASEIYHKKKVEVEQDGVDDGPANDLISIMIKANLSSQEKARLTAEELIGNVNAFLLGGQETTALAKMLYILAREPQAQARLRTQVREARSALTAVGEDSRHTRLPYDVLIGLPFLDAVVRETLRLHPPTNMMNRVTAKDIVLPLRFPVRSVSGKETSSVLVPAGTNVLISILDANRNKDVWGTNANEWRPERWLTASGARIGAGSNVDVEFGDESHAVSPQRSVEGATYPGVYGGMMTFLGGSRACIGFKFAEMEIKQILSTLVSTMHFAPPSAVDERGARKEIYWRMDGLQVPVVPVPHGDRKTPQVPLDIRLATEEDFL